MFSGFEKYNFDAEFGIVGSDFTTGSATANDSGDFGRAGDFDSIFGSEMFNKGKVGDSGSFGLCPSGKNEIFGAETFFGDGNSVRIKKIGEAFETSDAGIFVDFFIITTGFDDSFEFASGKSGEIKVKILIFHGWESLNSGISVRKIECNRVGEVVSIKVGATEKSAFD